MTKARNIADLLDANGIVDNAKITLDANEIPNLDASKITSGSVASARLGNIDLTNLSASNLTSGTIPDARITALDATKLTGSIADARIPASAVSQHATSFNDNDIVNDLSTIALRSATTENAIAYNTNSSFIDVFQDASGIASNTNAPHNASEYVASVFSTEIAQRYYRLYKTSSNAGGGYHEEMKVYVDDVEQTLTTSMLSQHSLQAWVPAQLIDNNNSSHGFHTDSANVGSFVKIDFGSGNEKSLNKWQFYVGDPQSVVWSIQYSNDNSNWTNAATGWTTDNTTGTYTNKIQTFPKPSTSTENATGNFIGNTITASSSTSSMGAIITYQDNVGTNSLNTDIVLQLSADNGSNFTTATLTALPNYSTGIKMAKVNDLSVTAGTQLKYKISFANQSLGSKEARIRGVSLQY